MIHVQRWLLIAFLAVAVTGVLPARSAETIAAIAPMALVDALNEFSTKTGLQIVYRTDIARGVQSPGASAGLSADDTVAQLLRGTGLVFERINARTIAVMVKADAKSGANATATATSGAVVPVGDGARVADAGASGGGASGAGTLEEIVVTAQKRAEPLLEVPVPVTVLAAAALVDRNQFRLEDYYTSVPGLSVTPGDEHGSPQLAIRGITTGGFSNPTVGVVIDDVPYGASFGAVYGNEAPDVDPSDLSRIEVLRGPQGTLYGASSIGGLLKYVTVDPSTDALTGRVQVGTETVHNGDGWGYTVRGAVNVPLSETFAVRASGFTRIDPGFVDNVETGAEGVNRDHAYGGRLSSLWRPSDALSLKVSALLQDGKVSGSPNVFIGTGLGDLQQSDLRGSGWRRNRIEALSANLTAKIGSAELTVLSGYSVNTDADSYDFSDPNTGFGFFTAAHFGPGGAGAPLVEDVRTKKFTQEVRLSVPLGERVDWLVGAFYNHENTVLIEDVLGADPVTGVSVGSYGYFFVPSTFQEYAAFTDLSFHVTNQFDVQVGGRESENRQSFAQTVTGAYVPDLLGLASPAVYPDAHTKENSFTYLVTPRFKVSQDLMVYARLASGYRPGGPNVYATASALPTHYEADKTQNYEIGAKGTLLEHVLTFDASVYYIDWKDIQLQLRDPTTHITYYANGSRAKSDGVELSLEAKPVTGLTLGAWAALNDAKLTQNFPATSNTFGVSGDRLPNSARFSGNVSAEESLPLGAGVVGSVGGALSYVGNRESVFVTGSPERQVFPAYAQINLHSGVKIDSWAVNAFVNNLADKRAVLSGGIGSLNPLAFYVIQPRTVGVSVSKNF